MIKSITALMMCTGVSRSSDDVCRMVLSTISHVEMTCDPKLRVCRAEPAQD